MNADWKDSPIYPERYEVSNTGLVRSKSYVKIINRNGKLIYWTTSSKILSQSISKDGYARVCLRCNKNAKTITVHRLVAMAFVEGYSENLEVNHKDSNRLNNNSYNLEWTTHRENLIHSYKEGLNSNAKDEHPRAVLNSAIVKSMREDFANGLSYKNIATKYGKLYSTVWSAINNRNWKDNK